MGIANFAITAVLAFNRRGFVVRRGSVIVVVAWGLDVGSLIFLRLFSEEMVGCKLSSSEPCGCTLTQRDKGEPVCRPDLPSRRFSPAILHVGI